MTDKFTRYFKCPKCGKIGHADLSQEDGWAWLKGNRGTEIESMSADFSTIPNRGHEFGFEIHCNGCETKVEKIDKEEFYRNNPNFGQY